MKYTLLIPTIFATLLTASCAELNTALESANQVLGSLNGTVSGSTVSGSKSIAIAAQNTAQFQTRNIKLLVEPSAVCAGKYQLSLSGSAYNKTNKNLFLSYEMPTYNARGERKGSFVGNQMISPKEWNELGDMPVNCIEKFDVNTLKFSGYTL